VSVLDAASLASFKTGERGLVGGASGVCSLPARNDSTDGGVTDPDVDGGGRVFVEGLRGGLMVRGMSRLCTSLYVDLLAD